MPSADRLVRVKLSDPTRCHTGSSSASFTNLVATVTRASSLIAPAIQRRTRVITVHWQLSVYLVFYFLEVFRFGFAISHESDGKA